MIMVLLYCYALYTHATPLQLHETEGYKHVGDVELAIGAAIRGMGPEVFLTIVPLDLESVVRDGGRWLYVCMYVCVCVLLCFHTFHHLST